MRPRIVLLALGVLAVSLTAGLTHRQHRQIDGLRLEIENLSKLATELTNAITAAASQPVSVGNTSHPSLELLRLRNQVGQLERRKRELAGAPAEQHRLQVQLANRATTNANSGRLPVGYIRRAEAQNVGRATPEAALETFMWAIEHRDVETLMQCIDPKHREDIEKSLKQAGSDDDFFKGADGLVGGLIKEREVQSDGSVVLKLQINPQADDTENIRFRLVDGRWCFGP